MAKVDFLGLALKQNKGAIKFYVQYLFILELLKIMEERFRVY